MFTITVCTQVVEMFGSDDAESLSGRRQSSARTYSTARMND